MRAVTSCSRSYVGFLQRKRMPRLRVKATPTKSSFLKLVREFASREVMCRTPFTQNGMKSTQLRVSQLSNSSKTAFVQSTESLFEIPSRLWCAELESARPTFGWCWGPGLHHAYHGV